MSDQALSTIRSRMAAGNADALILTRPPDIRYLTGYPGDNAHVILTPDRIILFVYPLNRELAETTVSDTVEVITVEGRSVYQAIGSLGSPLLGETAWYDPNVLTCAALEKLREAITGTELREAPNPVEQARKVKTAREIEAIAHAQAITDRVFDEITGILREGITEREVAAEIDYRFRLAGGDGAAFPIIAAFGPRSALPHAVPGDIPLRVGDIVLIDMGTIAGGYASDMTRTLLFGRAPDTFKKRYQIVLDAQQAGIEALHGGVSCAGVHNAAQAVFEAAGCADRFIHSLGHGVGIEVHEAPTLSPKSSENAVAGTVVTIEPGLYYPGWGGIRIEDMAVITTDGCRILTGSSKTRIEL